MQLVRASIERYMPLTDAEWERIAPHWRTWTCAKGSNACSVGQVEQRFSIVRNGVLRLSFPHDGEELCLGFAFDGSWCGEYASFIDRKPARFNVTAMTDAELVGIDHAALQALYRELPCMERWGRLIAEELILGRAVREVEQMSLDAEERYRRLAARSPRLLQLVPLKDITSYLGMAPETLSRLRRKR
jgi:CRP-like cAMP-binding protein